MSELQYTRLVLRLGVIQLPIAYRSEDDWTAYLLNAEFQEAIHAALTNPTDGEGPLWADFLCLKSYDDELKVKFKPPIPTGMATTETTANKTYQGRIHVARCFGDFVAITFRSLKLKEE